MNKIAYLQQGNAPRLQAAWDAITATLTGDTWTDHPTLIAAAVATGVTPRTANNLLQEARSGHHLRHRNVGSASKQHRRWQYRAPGDAA